MHRLFNTSETGRQVTATMNQQKLTREQNSHKHERGDKLEMGARQGLRYLCKQDNGDTTATNTLKAPVV